MLTSDGPLHTKAISLDHTHYHKGLLPEGQRL